jgi:NAD(P)-dependent dehydrogenase (short-subunit alcohol dehydrogenase family)
MRGRVRLVLAGRRRALLDETAAAVGEALVVPADVTSETDCAALVDRTLAAYGRLDVLVNNAGAPGTDMPVAEMTLENWNATLAVNLTGPMVLAREALRRAMLPAARGNVQFVSSMAAVNVRARKAHYAAAKMALVPLTETLAKEVGPQGIRVNCIMVGLVAGDLVDRWVARMAAERGVPERAVRESLVADFPIRRPVAPEEVAAVSVFLASDAASALTGQTIKVSNGRV